MITNRIQLLAADLAEELNDKEHFGLYLRIAKRFPEGIIRQVLSTIKQTPKWTTIKRKGAYFIKSLYQKVDKKEAGV